MNDLSAYRFEIKRSPRARKVFSGIRFYPDDETAAADIARMSREEFGPEAEILSIEPTEDPR